MTGMTVARVFRVRVVLRALSVILSVPSVILSAAKDL